MDKIYIAGVDEAGRGPLAGPVVAAAVILDEQKLIAGLADSKLLSEAKRNQLYQEIVDRSLAYGIGIVDHIEIDRINILQASLLAMQRAVAKLSQIPHKILVDGNKAPEFSVPTEAIIQGDKTVPAISAASIIAKVVRDKIMVDYDQQFPGYGFAQHKGYGTKAHLEALAKLGTCEIHRNSFAPVRQRNLLV